jgi:hypothetical protein
MAALAEILIRRPKLSSEPPLRVGFHGVACDKGCMHVIALSAFKRAEIITGGAGRDACKHHSRLADHASGAFDGAQHDTEM